MTPCAQSISESHNRPNRKLITFFDLRHAAAAMQVCAPHMHGCAHMGVHSGSGGACKGLLGYGQAWGYGKD